MESAELPPILKFSVANASRGLGSQTGIRGAPVPAGSRAHQRENPKASSASIISLLCFTTIDSGNLQSLGSIKPEDRRAFRCILQDCLENVDRQSHRSSTHDSCGISNIFDHKALWRVCSFGMAGHYSQTRLSARSVSCEEGRCRKGCSTQSIPLYLPFQLTSCVSCEILCAKTCSQHANGTLSRRDILASMPCHQQVTWHNVSHRINRCPDAARVHAQATAVPKSTSG